MAQPDKIAELIRAVVADRTDVMAVSLFGSAASGRMRALSDVDVAVLFNAGLTDAEMFARNLEIGTALEEALWPEHIAIDVGALNRATPALAFMR